MVGLDVELLSWLYTVPFACTEGWIVRAPEELPVWLEESSRTQALMQLLYTQVPHRILNTLRLNGFKVTQVEHNSRSNSIPVGTGPYTVWYSCYHPS